MPGTSTTTYGIDSTQRYKIVAATQCERVTVQENYDSATPPTADYKVAQPSGAPQVLVSKGVPFIFTPPNGAKFFFPQQVVGDIQTVSGSVTIQQIESQQV